MILFKKITDLRKWLDGQQKSARNGFVPTMGALHPGHVSLVNMSKRENNITVSSIFINPAQFNDPKDFNKYPVTIENDIDMLEEAGCDILFLPSVNEMYPEGMKKEIHYEVGYLETILEGKYRPGHFQGVCKVVHRLLDIVDPNILYLGQKDFQQCLVIDRLLQLIGKADQVKLNICPTLREAGGLAMSSRNIRLSKEERQKAVGIYETLLFIKAAIRPGKLAELKTKAVSMLEEKNFRVDYVEIADATDLTFVDNWNGKQTLIILIAAFLNEVRLIDNIHI